MPSPKSEPCNLHTYNFGIPRSTPGASPFVFKKKCLSDSGCSRSVISKDLLDRYGIKYEPNILNERLVAAGGGELHVNGTVALEATFYTDKLGNSKSCFIDFLVSDSLYDEVIISWYNAQSVGALKISEDFDFDPSRCAAVHNLMPADVQEKIITELYDKFTCFSATLTGKQMKGEPMVINLRQDIPVVPKKWYTPVSIPLHFKDAANRLLDDLIKNEVIRQIKLSSAPQFCARGFFVAKPGGVKNGVRLVVDHKEANKYIERPVHPFIAGTKLLKNLPSTARYFAKIDCLWGYYQVPLAEKSKHITTFICERGTFEYNCAPMGLNCSGDEFCRRSDAALEGATGVLKLVDDILVYADSIEQLKTRLNDVLQRCEDNGITISKKKIEIGTKVTFAGFDVSAEGNSPTPDRIEAIKNFPTPKNITGVRGFHGLTQGFNDYAYELSQIDKPIRDCLSTKNAFHWGPDQEESMRQIKDLLTGSLVLKNFNPDLETQLITDASREGIGFILRQKEPLGSSNKWRLIQCGSRALNGPETRYAVCEIEALGVMFGIQKCRHFLLGMKKFEVLTDHKSLKGVFEKDLAAIENVRLRRCMEKLQEYTFSISYIEGKNNKIADTLSRFPVKPATGSDGGLDEAACICKSVQNVTDHCYHESVHSIRSRVDEPDPKLQELIDAAKEDPNYQLLVGNIQKYKHFGKKRKGKTGKKEGLLGPGPEGTNLPPDSLPGKEFWSPFQRAWGLLSVHETGLAVYNHDRIVVPTTYRKSILCEIHKGHPGTSKSKWRLRRDYWWPGYSADIEAHVKDCKECVKYLPSQQIEPLINQNVATHPMEILGIDLWHSNRKDFLVMVDQFSGFPMVQMLPSISSASVLGAMAFYFNLLGNPRLVISDQGKQLTSKEYENFLKRRGIKKIHSAAYNPQANGLAESGVKAVKTLLEECGNDWKKFDEELLNWRDTPNQCGYAPGHIFFARRMKTSLPILPGKTSLDPRKAIQAAEVRKKLRTREYEKRSSRELTSLDIGDRVFVQEHDGRKHWIQEATITGKDGPRGYQLKMEDGSQTTRNRRQLRPAPPQLTPTYVIPDGWIEQELDVIDPPDAATETSYNEGYDLDSGEEDAVQASEETAEVQRPPALRTSARSTKGKTCQSCPGCRLIYNYLNVIDNFVVSTVKKLQPILRWALVNPSL